ncbi:MAG: hypothetical protein SFV21_07045 [Rhodospirillaceae bacterium]|nr:hypothetical protein [Rhodospirillaceae bacterium]
MAAATQAQAGDIESRIGQIAVILLSAGVIGGYMYWNTFTGVTAVECVGAHVVGLTQASDESTLVLLPTLGNENYKVTMGPDCKNFDPASDAMAASGQPKLCVGDDLAKLGAKTDCKVQAITQLRQTEVSALLTQDQ